MSGPMNGAVNGGGPMTPEQVEARAHQNRVMEQFQDRIMIRYLAGEKVEIVSGQFQMIGGPMSNLGAPMFFLRKDSGGMIMIALRNVISVEASALHVPGSMPIPVPNLAS
jgi:hypothetical protein